MADENLPEEWRPVEGWPYEVSSLGRVRRSVNAINWNGALISRKGRMLQPMLHTRGYHFVGLKCNGRHKQFLVHRLVCVAFHGPQPSAEHEVAHRDGTRTHNHKDNLRWTTSAGNSSDMVDHGRSTRGQGNLLTASQVLEIRQLLESGSWGVKTRLAKRFGVSRGTIQDIASRRNWAWLNSDHTQN